MFLTRKALGLCIVGVLVLTARTSAQHPFTPGVAFGAYVYPYVEGNRDVWGVQFDLFTELSKDLDAMTGGFEVYNDIDRTLGFNQIGYTRVRATPVGVFWWHQAYWGAAGVVWDTPTEFLQNDFAHGLRRLTYVPREGVVEHVVFGVGSDQTVSYPWQPLAWLQVGITGGGGAGVSTAFLDWHLQGGADLALGPGGSWLGAGGLYRYGRVQDPVDWDRLDRGLHDRYRMWQAWLLLPVDDWIGAWAPRSRVAYTHSTGPWAEAGLTGPIRERLWSVALESPRGQWGLETWNDFGFKDLGPTFGLRIQWYR